MTTPPSIRALIVDDHPLLREGLVAILAGQPDIALAGEAAKGAEAVEQFRRLKPDVTLLGYVAAGKANKEIARLLSVSEDTVKAHMRSILAKLDVVDRTLAVTAALRRGIIEL